MAQLQLNLVRSHAAGVGPELDEAVARHVAGAGQHAGAGAVGRASVVVQTLVDLLNHGIHPCIPCQGSWAQW
ncbi:MAG: aromatic amino acid lyase [Caldilineaceae bacterium]